jgi:SAM-dependent MidA family methyltransferase
MNSLNEIIRDEAAKRGVLPFARFMELALYHPELGYYETQAHSPGRHGDFYTSVSTGELFGQLLAFQFAEWLEEIETLNLQPSTLNLIEAGAHDGRLAADILGWLQVHRPKLFDRIEYVILEPSARRQEWQKETLKHFAPRVRWASSFQSLLAGTPQWSGILFSNELLDAFPVHRFGWDAKEKKWFEWGVAVAGDKFIWAKIPIPHLALCTPQLEAVLPDGYTVETSPAAENWWREAAGVLARGKLLTIDYGFTADELFSPARNGGTLRTYFRHHATDDILVNPGEQDITAHVNFSAIRNAGEDAGLTTEFFGSQAKFLVDILAATAKDSLSGKWNAAHTRQFQTLTHPEHLGRAFRVLVQSANLFSTP